MLTIRRRLGLLLGAALATMAFTAPIAGAVPHGDGELENWNAASPGIGFIGEYTQTSPWTAEWNHAENCYPYHSECTWESEAEDVPMTASVSGAQVEATCDIRFKYEYNPELSTSMGLKEAVITGGDEDCAEIEPVIPLEAPAEFLAPRACAHVGGDWDDYWMRQALPVKVSGKGGFAVLFAHIDGSPEILMGDGESALVADGYEFSESLYPALEFSGDLDLSHDVLFEAILDWSESSCGWPELS